MYKFKKESNEIEDSIIDVCVISDENGTIITLTTDYGSAEEFIRLLNENSVERCHVVELAEDLFYS